MADKLRQWLRFGLRDLMWFTVVVAAYTVHLVPSKFQPGRDQPTSIAEHWNVVNDWRLYIENPANYEFEPSGRLYGATEPFDHEPSLAALVAARELEHIDLVLPLVPNSAEANRYWMTFTAKHSGFVHATGNPKYVAYEPTGHQPLHLQLWFKESAAGDVQQLIKDLETLADEEG